MGATDSKQKLGERVIAARKKLSDDVKLQSERVQDIESKSPQTIKVIMSSIAQSFQSCSPFVESMLLIAWQLNPDECGKIVLDTCKRILTAPIKRDEYEWFIKYVFVSSIWMFKTSKGRYMFEELIDIVYDMQQNIVDSMNSIYNHLEFHPEWQKILAIKNQNIVQRQDHPKVGLLQELEMKQATSDDLQTFIDSSLAVNMLAATAKNINSEFQNHIKTVMSHYGDVKAGPIKKVDRCVSKLENDYQNEAYPKSAKLLDLVRCSVTFNTVEQLVSGYDALTRHISKHSSMIELARVKNGFLNKTYKGGYRDIKVNVIYHSSNPEHVINGLSMICEVQLILGQYLHEKKRIHKLYSIVRQQEYFKMTVSTDDEKQGSNMKDVKDLKFEQILSVKKEVPNNDIDNQVGKCSIDSELGLLAVESQKKISCIDIKKKEMVFDLKYDKSHNEIQTHCWIEIDKQKYLSVQTSKNTIQFFKVNPKDYNFEESKDLEICLGEKDLINCCEFDQRFENMIIVKNGTVLEKRAVKNNKEILVSLHLETKIKGMHVRILSLSNDGNWCVIGGDQNYFYFIEIDNKVQHKVTSAKLELSSSPCFVNGDPEYCVVGGWGKFEVWDVQKRVSIKVIDLNMSSRVNCLTSSNNILAAGRDDYKMSLWDTQTWEMFWCEKYDIAPCSVHLTSDLKYLTVGGWHGERSVILEIK